MKYVIMFFCVIFCAVGDVALWVAEKMAELVDYGAEKVRELYRGESHGAHEKNRLLIAGNSCDDGGPASRPAPTGDFYDWAMED